MDSSADMEEMGQALLDMDGTLVLPQNVLSNETDFSLDKSFISEEQGATGEQLANLFHIDEQTKEMTADIFDTLLLPIIKEEAFLVTPPSTPQKRPLQNPKQVDNHKRFKPCRPIDSPTGSQVTPEPVLHSSSLTPVSAPAFEKAEADIIVLSSPAELVPEAVLPKPKHVCSECGKIFKRAHNLKIHGRLHSGAKPYACPFSGCNKEFRWKSSIVSHMNWHRTKKGDTLPGEPGDTSIQNAALRQGTTRGDAGVAGPPVPENKAKTKEEQRPSDGEPPETQMQANGRGEEEVGEASNDGSTAGERGEAAEAAEVELNELLVEIGGLVSGCGYRGLAGGNEKDGAVLTPSTTAESYSGSQPAIELDDLESLNVFAERATEEEGKEEEEILPSLSCCRLDGPGDPLDVLLDEEKLM